MAETTTTPTSGVPSSPRTDPPPTTRPPLTCQHPPPPDDPARHVTRRLPSPPPPWATTPGYRPPPFPLSLPVRHPLGRSYLALLGDNRRRPTPVRAPATPPANDARPDATLCAPPRHVTRGVRSPLAPTTRSPPHPRLPTAHPSNSTAAASPPRHATTYARLQLGRSLLTPSLPRHIIDAPRATITSHDPIPLSPPTTHPTPPLATSYPGFSP